MFAFAVWDPRHHHLVFARDRLGIKPFYWTEVDGQILFASETKAFFEHPDFRAQPDLDGVSSYLTFRQPVWDLTYLSGVRKILPGHVVRVDAGGVHEREYWRLPVPHPDTARPEGQWLEEIEARLTTAVGRCLIADVPVGAYLSGGLDSALMVALMSRLHGEPIHTFSAGYEEPEYDEGEYARRAADHIGTRHHHLILPREDFERSWADLVRQRDAPLSIPHEIPLYHLSVEVKRAVSVALAGDGADELFGGYGRVLRSPMDWRKISAARAVFGDRLSARLAALPGVRDTAVSWLRFPTQQQQFFEVYRWMPFQEKWSLLSPEAREALNGDARTVAAFDDAFAEVAGADPYDRILHVFQKIHLGCLLDKVDAMGMAASVEGRVPFVDHELVEAIVHMPRDLKLRWRSPLHRLRALTTTAARASECLDETKWALRQVAGRVLPPDLAVRKKLGFPTPLDGWLHEGMLGFAREVLLDPAARSRGLFDPTAVEAFLARPQVLDFDFYGKKVWMLLNVELWLREVIDCRRPVAPAA